MVNVEDSLIVIIFKHSNIVLWFHCGIASFLKVGKKKGYVPGTITKHECEIGLAYWMFDDGSYNKGTNYITLHAERFSLTEKEAMCEELNSKFGLHCYPMKRSGGYHMISLPVKDTPTIRDIMHMRPRVMLRKVPGGWNFSIDKDSVYSSLKSKIIRPNGGYESFIKTIQNSIFENKNNFLIVVFLEYDIV